MTHHRIGVLGGSFDPIHHGHLAAASEVAFRLDLDRVVFSPTGLAWLKPAPHAASAEHRYLMTVAATAAEPRFEVTRVDVDRAGPTYTVDTLHDLRAQFAHEHPDDTASWFFITGADALANFRDWHEPDRILTLAHLVGVSRPGHRLPIDVLPPRAVSIVAIPALDISSTDIRTRVSRGEPIRYLVPDSVVDFIAAHGLYAGSSS